MFRNFALRILGIGRPTPKTTVGKAYRWGERVLVLLGVLYTLVAIFPQPIFAHSLELNSITLYSRTPIPPQATEIMERIKGRIATSPLYDSSAKFRVFICDSPRLYTFFAPTNRGSFAISSPVTGNIFIASADLKANRAQRTGGGPAERAFHGVAAHEITHGLIRNHVGLLATWRMPRWLKEGYCEFIAGDSTIPEEEGVSMLLRGDVNNTMAFRYFKWRKMIEYLIVEKNRSVAEIMSGPWDEREVETEMLAWLQNNTPDLP